MEKEKTERIDELAQRITQLRKNKGMTLENLAYGVGISKGNLSEIEKGMHDPRYTTICAIADGLEISVSQLLKGL